MSYPEKGPEDRIAGALNVARQALNDPDKTPPGDAIDQMARALCGCSETYLGTYLSNPEYEAWMAGKDY